MNAAGRVHDSEERVLTSVKTRQSRCLNIRSTSPHEEQQLASKNFRPSFFKCFLAASSPSCPCSRLTGSAGLMRRASRLIGREEFEWNGAEGRKGFAMNRTRPKPSDRFEMLRRAVAFMVRETVIGIER